MKLANIPINAKGYRILPRIINKGNMVESPETLSGVLDSCSGFHR